MNFVRPLCVLAVIVSARAAERVVVFGQPLTGANEFTAALAGAGFDVRPIDAAQLRRLDELEARLAIIGPDGRCPPESRAAICRFLAHHGQVMVIGAGAFDYTPHPVRGVRAVDVADGAQYRILQPKLSGSNARYAVEPVRGSKTTTPGGDPALEFRTYLRGMNDTMLQFAADRVRDAKRTVLTFQANGDAYADLLAIEITDTHGRRWLSFVPLAAGWHRYAVSLADFLPRGWSKPDASPPALNPGDLATISLGIDAATVWREKPMAFAIGAIELAEDAAGPAAASSRLTALRLPFHESKTAVPAALFNPFEGSRRVDSAPIRLAEVTKAGRMATAPAWNCPTPLVFHPGVQMGTDHRKELDTKREREQRRIPLWRAGEDGPVVAELRVLAGGPADGSAVALFGIPPVELVRQKTLRDSVVETAIFMVRRPKIAAALINTTAGEATAGCVPTLTLRIQNPLDHEVRGRITVSIAAGTLKGVTALTLPARRSAAATVQLGPVPANFAFQHFDWTATLETEEGMRDVLRDTVDVERALLHALAHLVHTQRQFPDGRISHHYFGDAYGVRALFAYLDLVRREPERLQRNRDLWAATTVDDIRACGLRFVDMLLARQNQDGSIPLGYGEQSFTYNIADGGQMAVALGQVAPLLDPARREACWQCCRRFLAWAETFYIDETVAKKLAAEFGPAKEAQARAGHYGLGSSRGVRNPLGPSWVLSDILAAQVLLTYVDPNPDYRFIVDRNVRAYLDGGYTAAGYFQAEALTWAWLDATDAALRSRIAENLTTTFVPPLLAGKEDEMYELGARATLRALPMVYDRRYVADRADLRAALLKYVWSFASESSERSMRRLAEAHPKPQHGESLAASKYASFSAIWAVELLEPGASLLRAPGFPRGGAAPAKK